MPQRHHLTVAQRAVYIEDIVLVDRCLDGEEEAARDLFRRHRGRIHATLFRVLGSNRDIDDLLQDTFIQVFASLSTYRGEARLSTWIDRIAVRVAYRYLARNRRSPVVLVELDAPSDVDVHRGAVAREGMRRLYAALARLSPAARIAFALHEIDGKPIAEIAACTGSSVTATKVRVWRARKTLARMAADDPVLAEFLEAP